LRKLGESTAHRILKERARTWLKEKFGFRDDQIFEEYPVGNYRVDVAGISPSLKVAVECGKASMDKLRYLRESGFQVKSFFYTPSIHPGLLTGKKRVGRRKGGKFGRIHTLRISPIEDSIITDLAKKLEVSKAEVWRRLLWTVRVLFSDYLLLERALKARNFPEGVTLADALKSIPELMDEMLRRQEEILRAERKGKRR